MEVLVAAFNEEAVIGGRVANVLAQDYPGSLALAVGCDGCSDATASRARDAAPKDARVRVTEFGTRRGKASVLNDLVRESRAEVDSALARPGYFTHDAATAELVRPAVAVAS